MKIDEFLPIYDFNEIHKVTVKASPEQTFKAIKELTAAELSPLIFLMLDARNLPEKLLGKNTPTNAPSETFLEQLYKDEFVPLGEDCKEVVLGLVGQFWKLTGGETPPIPTPQAFLDFDNPAFAKVATNLAVTVDEHGSTLCSTETRIQVPDPSTRRKFAFYWKIISMGSGWIRVLWLKAIKKKAEQGFGV